MLRMMLSAICVLATAGQLSAGISPANIEGRWQGKSWAGEGDVALTLDIVRCGGGWCGIKVAADNSCQGTALKLDAGAVGDENVTFTGRLELAPGTEPYVVHATIFAPEPGSGRGLGVLDMMVTGDTGGEYRAYRRSFPFEAQLTRITEPTCHAPQTVSSLQ